LRHWLIQTAIHPHQAVHVLVAVGEAMTNAIEHGHRDRPGGAVALCAATLGDRLELTVTDTGTWKPPDPAGSPLRGRGIILMRGLMDEVDIAPGAQGTAVRMHATIRAGAGRSLSDDPVTVQARQRRGRLSARPTLVMCRWFSGVHRREVHPRDRVHRARIETRSPGGHDRQSTCAATGSRCHLKHTRGSRRPMEAPSGSPVRKAHPNNVCRRKTMNFGGFIAQAEAMT
jgi:anti-sigma regulatory factor (Ser/Thr protein kinase)